MLEYSVSKEKGSNRYYVHYLNRPACRLTNAFKTKKRALHTAAEYNKLDYKTYMKLYRKGG